MALLESQEWIEERLMRWNWVEKMELDLQLDSVTPTKARDGATWQDTRVGSDYLISTSRFKPDFA
jgi:hypothetical protein